MGSNTSSATTLIYLRSASLYFSLPICDVRAMMAQFSERMTLLQCTGHAVDTIEPLSIAIRLDMPGGVTGAGMGKGTG